MTRRWVAASAVLASALACASPQEIPPHPIGEINERVRSRIDRIELVIGDSEKARTVTDLYLELEQVILTYRTERAAIVHSTLHLEGTDEEVIKQKVDALAAKGRVAERRFGDNYTEIQMKLRQALTPEEFAAIDALR